MQISEKQLTEKQLDEILAYGLSEMDNSGLKRVKEKIERGEKPLLDGRVIAADPNTGGHFHY